MASNTAKSRSNIYETITAKIVAAIDASPGEPILPWQRGGMRPVIPINAATGNAYRGVNILSLWVTALERGYNSGTFATYKQWAALGAQVRKGETAAPIVFYREFEKTADGAASGDHEATETIRMARGYWVFAAEQVDGFAAPSALPPNPIDRIAAADSHVTATRARIAIGGATACWRPATDTIHMPDEARFFATDDRGRSESYYGTLAHELVHWTSPAARCDRDLGGRFGDDRYCAEEVIAETGAAFLCARLGIANEPHPDHARYIAHWLTVMKADSRAMFTAAAQAQAAVAHLDNLQPDAARLAA